MKSGLARLVIVLTLALVFQALTLRAQQADPGDWTDLLADTSLKQWTRLPIPPTEPLAQTSPWKPVEAGVLICEGDRAGHEWLRLDREFGDFVLHVEWRFTEVQGEPRYNSGIFVRNSADATIWHQAQTGSAAGGFLFGDTLVSGVKERINLREQMKEQRVRPAGEWNTYEIRAEGKRITLWVNGAVTSELTDCEIARGYIGLEAEGYRIEFRNVKIKELP